jgi:SAM-dependent methyltransferase
VETFSPDWLALREPADHAARATTLVERAAEALKARRAHAPASAVRVIDLGSGSGSNLRYLAPRLPAPQRWHLLDHDATLLAVAAERAPAGVSEQQTGTPPGGIEVATHRVDLRMWPGVLGVHGGDTSPSATMVTGSALLDLVSAAWLEGLADQLQALGAVGLFVLSYDGRIVCEPSDPLDAEVRDLVNRHQKTDKGFGPAAGPDATSILAPMLSTRGYTVHVASSDWHLGAESDELQRQLVAGWAGAAAQVAPERADVIAAWQTRRLECIAGGHSRIRVGHQDVLAYPASPVPSTHAGGQTA